MYWKVQEQVSLTCGKGLPQCRLPCIARKQSLGWILQS